MDLKETLGCIGDSFGPEHGKLTRFC